MDRPPVHHRANAQRQTIIHTCIHTYTQFRLTNLPNKRVFRLQEESTVSRENPHKQSSICETGKVRKFVDAEFSTNGTYLCKLVETHSPLLLSMIERMQLYEVIITYSHDCWEGHSKSVLSLNNSNQLNNTWTYSKQKDTS